VSKAGPNGSQSLRDSAQDAATEFVFSAGWNVVRRMPERAAYRSFDVLADQLWKRRAGGVVQLEANLRRVHPEASPQELRERSRAGMRSYMRYYCETFRLPDWDRARIAENFVLERVEIMDDAMAAGTGIIMVPGHMANWDQAGAWGALRYGGLTTVAERLKPEGLFQQFLDLRSSMGIEVLGHGDEDVLETLAQRLRGGGLVAILGDRDLSRSGVEVDFFGERASLPAGPALLSIMTGAPVHPVTMWFAEDGIRGYVHDRIEIPEQLERTDQISAMTQELANAFEQGIREHSVDWHMLQKVWLADLDGGRRRSDSGTP
jgi:phosphatidylinositol dimannoside acyltransferase